MKTFLEMEYFKIYKSKQFIMLLLVLILSFSFSFGLSYYEPGDNTNFARYFYYIFTVNGQFLFPIGLTFLFAALLTSEYTHGTIQRLLGSKFSREEMYLGKLLAGVTFSFFVLSFLTILYLMVSLIFADLESITIAYYTKTQIGAMIDFIIIYLAYFTFLCAYASYVLLISQVTKHQGLTFLICVGTLIFYNFIPLPEAAFDYIFISQYSVYSVLSLLTLPLIEVLKSVLCNAFYFILFSSIGIYFFKKQEI